MKRAIIRSTLFNILFYCVTGLLCVALLPTLILPRRYYMATVHIFVHTVYFLERHVLRLEYRVEGLEHVPQDGPYIIAAKHQSPYETMKLHILFKDPAVILKKELLRIPLWGQYLGKSDPIAIDRSDRDSAISSIQKGAVRVKNQGRPIVIFPQGTRVMPDTTTAEKPYKVGVARMQEATGLPIIPLALNAGVFWPRSGWLKSKGVVTFKFLKPIEAGQDRRALMADLEEQLETASAALVAEARAKKPKSRAGLLAFASLVFLALIAGAAYTTYWFTAAETVKAEYMRLVSGLQNRNDFETVAPRVSGFPGKIHLSVPQQRFSDAQNTVAVNDLEAAGWPVPGAQITVQTGEISFRNMRWNKPLVFQALDARFTENDSVLKFSHATLRADIFSADLSGTLDLKQTPFPAPDLTLSLNNHTGLIQMLIEADVLNPRTGLFLSSGLANFADENNVITVPIAQRNRTIFAGPLPVVTLPPDTGQASFSNRRTPPPVPSDPGLDSLPRPAP